MTTSVLWIALVGCDGGQNEAAVAAREFVEQSFAETVKPGPVGIEAIGKGVWWRVPALDGDCLRDKQLAFRNAAPGAGATVSPTYEAQRVFQAATDTGFCIWLGEDLALTTKEEVEQIDGVWVVDATFAMGKPTKWWECVDPLHKERPVRVLADAEGTLAFESPPELFGGDCPHPLPLVNPERKPAGARPKAAPSGSPSSDDVKAAAKRLDDALWAGDLAAALEATACYNLYEEHPFGACSAAELVNVGPITRDELRRRDGPPWTMNVFDSLGGLGRISRDRDDPTLFHVVVERGNLRNPKRTISVQWVDGSWRVVGLVQRKAEGLTTVEYVTDLGRNDKRRIFERRLAGEDIDHRGLPPLKDEDVY